MYSIRQKDWYGNINPQQCIGGFFGQNETCTIDFAVCRPLPANVCGDGGSTGVCQTFVNSAGAKKYDTGKVDFVVHEQSKLFLILI